jgi:tRNA dimethylallyltransferase
MKNKKPFIVIIFGPTGVGKSDLAERLAPAIGGEIINGDMGQLYTKLSIGTAKPDWRKSPIQHHLFDIINEPKSLTAFEYQKLLTPLIAAIHSRGSVPIIVGGSGFYLTSLFFPPQESFTIESSFNMQETADLWAELAAVDPERAAQINPNDIYRLQRALTIWRSSGVKPSTLAPVYAPCADFMLICVQRSRDELYDRINARVKSMIDVGWIEEVAPLVGTKWEEFLKKKKIIGYDAILEYLHHPQTFEAQQRLVTTISQQTRNYAKRQMTYWRGLERRLSPHIRENSRAQCDAINLTLLNLDLYIEQLSLTIQTVIKNG